MTSCNLPDPDIFAIHTRRSQSKFKEFLRSEEMQEEKFSGYAADKSNGVFCSVNRDVDPTKFSCKFNKYNMWINTGFREVRAFPIYRVATNYEEYVRYINGFLHVFYVSSSVDSGLYKDLWYKNLHVQLLTSTFPYWFSDCINVVCAWTMMHQTGHELTAARPSVRLQC